MPSARFYIFVDFEAWYSLPPGYRKVHHHEVKDPGSTVITSLLYLRAYPSFTNFISSPVQVLHNPLVHGRHIDGEFPFQQD